jgi:esterase FrsA
MVLLSVPCFAQQRAERTIDEIKIEAIHRAEVGQYPLIGLDPGDVKEAFASIHTRKTKTSGRRPLWEWPTAT